MANLVRLRTLWSGPPVVGEGVSTFYLDEGASGFLSDFHTFWAAVGNRVPTGITWTTPNTGDLVDINTGELTGTWTDGSSSSVSSSGAGAYAAGVGARFTWPTSGIRNGRRVRGSTFLVPLVTSCYQADGTIDGAVWTSLSSAAGALYTGTAPALRVWSRPVNGAGGQSNTVIGSALPDKVSWLRSRRT